MVSCFWGNNGDGDGDVDVDDDDDDGDDDDYDDNGESEFFLNGYRNLAISCGCCEVLLDLRVLFHQSRLSRVPVTWFLLLVNVHVNGEYPHGGCL